jgi:protein-tyrosine kinase
MERITEALHKARAERQHPAETQPQSTSAPNKASKEPIKYQKTRIISASRGDYAKNRLIAAVDNDPRAHAFRMLRTQVLRILRENEWNTLAITAPTQGAGKSLVAANLAVSISKEVNQTVLLVDLDLRRPGICQYFGFKPEFGLADYLTGDITIESIMINPGMERLVVIPGKGTCQNSSELITSPRMLDLATEISNRYTSRIIIYDLPPLLAVDDAIAFLPNIDSALLVVENGANNKEDVLKSVSLLGKTNFIGTVLNKVPGSTQDYYGY